MALRSIGQPPDARSFQFNRLIAGIVARVDAVAALSSR